MGNKQGITLAISALAVYILGGVSAFAGLAMLLLMRGQDFFGWGDASGIGWLFLTAGMCLSILGVLLMRLFRNRGIA